MRDFPPPDIPRPEALRLLNSAFADPHRLVDLIAEARSDAEAAQAVSEGFGIAVWQAQIVLDQQIMSMSAGRMLARSRELSSPPQ